MQETQSENRVAQSDAERSVDSEPGAGATAVAAARLLANPRRVRRA